MFEWDETKRQLNLLKHGYDFEDAATLFDGRFSYTFVTKRDEEERFATIAMLDSGECVACIWTWRGDNRRVISIRRARHVESGKYRSLLG